MKSFVYQSLPSRVVFGAGSISSLTSELERLGSNKVMVLCTPQQRNLATMVAGMLGEKAVAVYDQAVMHVPIETANDARRVAQELGADCCVAIGGGSTVGLGKAIAMTSDMPILAIPTTFAGSEMTPIFGITEAGLKKTGRDIRVLPKVVIYDPELLVTLPASIAGTSGMNAIAHSVEALYAQDANPIISLMAEESIRALSESLPKLVEKPGDIEFTSQALYGAWLAGACLGAVGMAIHHKLCHTLGGTFNLPHAEMHTIVLPHSVAYNRDAAPEAMAKIAKALRADDAAKGLYDLAKSLGVPLALSEIGMPKDGLEKAADIATQNPYFNPRPIEKTAIVKLLSDAYAGRRPT
jgi:maleylacetate reductase